MKKCIWCNNILDKSNPDEVSHCVCLECATRVRSVLSIEDVKTKRAKKQKAVEVFNKVRVFALEARKNLEKIGFSKDTIKQILSLDKFSVDDVKECKYCNTVNMLFEGKT